MSKYKVEKVSSPCCSPAGCPVSPSAPAASSPSALVMMWRPLVSHNYPSPGCLWKLFDESGSEASLLNLKLDWTRSSAPRSLVSFESLCDSAADWIETLNHTPFTHTHTHTLGKCWISINVIICSITVTRHRKLQLSLPVKLNFTHGDYLMRQQNKNTTVHMTTV